MLDIIIPAYNSHKTIDKTIQSIIGQSYKDYKITIVNDAGEPYDLSKYDVDIQELDYSENKGPGYARNYGLKNTFGDYVMFIDADDYLLENALYNLMSKVEDNTGVLIGTIIAENPDGTVRPIKGNGNFFHGKLYSRKFLEEYNILCNEESRCCEDDSFNSLALLCLDGQKYKEKIIPTPVYKWCYTQGSLGRKDPIEWEHHIVPKEMLNNKIYVYREAEKRNVSPGRLLIEKVRTMIHMTINYLRDKYSYPQFEEDNWENVKRCYTEIYKPITDKVTENIFDYAMNLYSISDDAKRLTKQQIREIEYWDKPTKGKIDIIIPCYNSHETLPRTLASILMQSYKNYTITIVNDGGKNYHDIVSKFSSFMEIRELSYKENKGVSHARNFGLDRTNNEFIMFIDSDDVLSNTFALKVLLDKVENENAVIGIGGFLEETDPFGFVQHVKDSSFIHGKLYRREFIEKYNIRFNEQTKSNEDMGFNLLCMMLQGNEKVITTEFIVAYWLVNKNSTVRKNKIEYTDKDCFLGYVDNMIYVFDELKKRNVNNAKTLEGKVTVMERIYVLYKERITRSPEYKDINLQACKKYYNEIYKNLKPGYSLLQKSYNTLKTDIPFEEIVEFIKSLGE